MKPASQYYTSPLSAFCAERLPGDFHYLDGDEVLFRHSALPIAYARETGTLRILESKFPGEQLRRSQKETFPLLAAALRLLANAQLVRANSGVYIVEGEPPFDEGATISRVRGVTRPGIDWSAVGVQFERQSRITARQFYDFVRCRL